MLEHTDSTAEGGTHAEKPAKRLLLLVTVSSEIGDGTGWGKEVMEKEKTATKATNLMTNVMQQVM